LTTRRDELRFAAFVGVVVAAFVFGFVRDEAEARGFTLNLADALGFAALALLALQLLAPAPRRITSTAFRPTVIVRFHGRFGQLALAAAGAHVVLLFVDDTGRMRLLDFVDAPGRARAAVIALAALVLLTAASLRRRRGRQTRSWRILHVSLGVIALAFAVGHATGVGRYLGLDAVTGTAVALIPSAVLLLVYFRPDRALHRM
jgi:3-phenylpropionate/trans-cinnamate dioxygenase ferredoxin reductase subunit